MKKLTFVILFLSGYFVQAQNETNTISITFENAQKVDVLKKIETISNFTFFYIDTWLDNQPVSGHYTNVSINKILDDVFSNSDLNYYISEGSEIILTHNIVIHKSLPYSFFGDLAQETNALETDKKPVFYKEEKESNIATSKTIRIGKESEHLGRDNFTLSGYVKYRITGKPIPGLILIADNINTITDKNGFYSLQLKSGVHIIETRAIGIEKTHKKIVLYNNGALDFNLNESSELLNEVVVVAGADRNVEKTIPGIIKIGVENIKNIPLVLGERDILKVAATLPGIKTAGEGSSGYNVRGGKEDQNLILLDDGVIYNPSHFFGIFSGLNPFTTGDVNIYKGNIPSEYGGRLSAVFDLKTKKPNTQQVAGEASIGPVTSNLVLEVPIVENKAGVIFGLRTTYSNWLLKSLDNKSLKNSEASFSDFIIKYNHEINKNNTIDVTGYYSKDKYSITSDSLYGYNNSLATFKWNHAFNNKNNLSVIVANSNYKFDIEYDGDTNTDFNLGYKINETELKLKMSHLYAEKHKIAYGISSKLYHVDPGSIVPGNSESIIERLVIPKEKALESALFISDDFEINDKLSINVGARYSIFNYLGPSAQNVYATGLPKNEGTRTETLTFDNNEVVTTYKGAEIRTSFRYFLASDFSIKGGYNSTYQYIHTLENNTTISPTTTWKLSDLNIKPQQANQYTLGLYKNLEANKYEISLEGYYKRSKNILDYKVGANLLLNESIDTEVFQGEGKAYGIEFLIKKNKGRVNGWLGYSFSRSLLKLDSEHSEERVNNGEYFPSNFDKPHDFSLITNYRVTKRFSFSVSFSYQTGRPITYPVGKYIFNNTEFVAYSNRNEFRIPDYYRLDIGFNAEGDHRIKKFSHSFWNFSIYNVLGRNNPYSMFFVEEDGEIKAYQSSIFSVPIPTITYNIKF